MRGFSSSTRHVMGGGRHKRNVVRHKVTRKVQKRRKAKLAIKIKGTPEQVLTAVKKVAGTESAEAAPKEGDTRFQYNQ